MKGTIFQPALILVFLVVFVFAFNGGSAASPYVADLTVTTHSGGLKCDYTLAETPVTGDKLSTATAWYKDGSPLMVLYLPFEGGSSNSLLDYSGNDTPVTIGETWQEPTWIPDGGHDGGGAYGFDGGDFMDAGNIFPVRSSYTKTAWIYREILYPESLWHNIISGHSHGENNHCFKVNPDGCLGAGHNAGIVAVSDPDPILEKTWYFVAVTFDHDTGSMRLYKNGQQVDTATLDQDLWDVTDPGVYIGQMETYWRWQGKLDDCRIYNYVLTADQIRTMYESGSNVIAPSEVTQGEQWYAAVTPFNTTQAGDTLTSNTITIGDDDSDGVSNADDLCPDTPEGTLVDEDGCALSQLDSDNDGVTDDLDLCPDTPQGYIVDTDGCSTSQIDSDGDGVADDIDLCPETPEGEDVDEDGCALSQLDSDSDGITDNLDLCPDTPEGDEVDEDGCSSLQRDSDNDGIPDYLEQGPDPENPDPDYDGNEDGTADYLQDNVVSCFTSDDEYYVTLVVTDPAGATLTNVEALEPTPALPEETEFPYGSISFTINGLAAGGTATVELHLPDGGTCDTYYKYGLTLDDQTDHWYEFMYDDSTKTGAQIDDNVITLRFVDGQRGDDDLMADGVIMDDGAPAKNTLPIVPEAAGGGGGGGCFITTGAFSSYAAVQFSIALVLGFAAISLARLEMKRQKK